MDRDWKTEEGGSVVGSVCKEGVTQRGGRVNSWEGKVLRAEVFLDLFMTHVEALCSCACVLW